MIYIINEAASFLKIKKHLFVYEDIIENFCDTLKSLGLIHNENGIMKQRDRLILALLVLMHKREFRIGADVFGKTELDFPADNFGKLSPLQLRGIIQVPNLTFSIVITLIETPINFNECCDSCLLVEKEINIKGNYRSVFDETADLKIGENGLLTRL